jgi:hypothetical protein
LSRESATAKGRRYIVEGRLTVRALDEHGGVALADCKGGGAIYSCGRDERGRWFCNCPALTAACAHLEALRLVVALEPRAAK